MSPILMAAALFVAYDKKEISISIHEQRSEQRRIHYETLLLYCSHFFLPLSSHSASQKLFLFLSFSVRSSAKLAAKLFRL